MINSVAATGDAGDINCWSGIPYHFAMAAMAAGLPAKPCRIRLEEFAGARRWWNLRQLFLGRGLGGYQYSESFLERAERAVPSGQWAGRVVTFNQHFPRGRTVVARGGRLVHYIDATFASFCRPGGLAEKLPRAVRERACALERENYATSDRVVTMSRWAAESVVRDCGVSRDKVATILPGANLSLPTGFTFTEPAGWPGKDRPLRLGFLGKDWRRKGLPFLLEVRRELQRRGVAAEVRCAGVHPSELAGEAGLSCVGFIDKARSADRFLEFLTGCDVGCLFSGNEPLGISTLEFLRAGVPVAGFVIEGVADTLPPDAGFRFEPSATAAEVADELAAAFKNSTTVARLRANARIWSPQMTWGRCVREWRELLSAGEVTAPAQLWRGLDPTCSSRTNETVATHRMQKIVTPAL